MWRDLHNYASFSLEEQSTHYYWRSGAFPVGGGTAWDTNRASSMGSLDVGMDARQRLFILEIRALPYPPLTDNDKVL